MNRPYVAPRRVTLIGAVPTRAKVGLSGLAAMMLLITGIDLQRQWDAECAATQPGTHWNGDDWLCEKDRK